jgi:predicted ArsR family transcriptional regulator
MSNMRTEAQQTGERKTRRAIVKLLKTEGPIDSAQLAERLGLTAMAVRQHLYALQSQNLVTAEERPVPVGRPAKYWSLTREADRLFPEAYAFRAAPGSKPITRSEFVPATR